MVKEGGVGGFLGNRVHRLNALDYGSLKLRMGICAKVS
jgi:hypothetical protein